MADRTDPSVRIVLRPDRRQSPDRRGQARGGRRAADQRQFEVTTALEAESGPEAQDEWDAFEAAFRAPRRDHYVH